MSPEDEQTLRNEFEGHEGSFLLTLRVNLQWDRQAFKRLCLTMLKAVAHYQGREELPRWVCEGFWFCHTFTSEWTQHESFPRPDAPYHQNCLEILYDLAYSLFFNESPLQEGAMDEEINALPE